MSAIKPCPICDNAPYVEEVSPWNKRRDGPAPWAVGCHRYVPFEHFVGVNGNDRDDAKRLWNIEAERVGALSAADQRQEGVG